MVSDKPLTPKFAPYASSKAVLQVIGRFRDTGLPEPLTFEALERIGVPSTMTSPTFRALRFLALVDEVGNRLPEFERLRRAASSEYQTTLAEVLRSSYSEVFNIVDPAQDAYELVQDAFRGFDPANQRGKMVRLFMGLCEEAGIVPSQPKRRRRPTSEQGKSTAVQESIPKPSSTPARVSAPTSVPTPEPSPPNRSSRYDIIDAIVAQLPDDGRWSVTRRERWLKAIESAVDLLIETGDEEGTELFNGP